MNSFYILNYDSKSHGAKISDPIILIIYETDILKIVKSCYALKMASFPPQKIEFCWIKMGIKGQLNRLNHVNSIICKYM